MIVLGIETTCDETACALVRDGHEVLYHCLTSQIDLHKVYGGVYPELAARRHLETILPIIQETISGAKISFEAIDLIAVASGPGLIGPLLIGLQTAKALAMGWNIPFVGVNHVEAHLYAAMMQGAPPLFPSLGVVVSGGHTFLVRINDIGSYELIGTTVDDALGEAFDKVASMLGLPYPGGPQIEAIAKLGDPTRITFKRGKVKEHPFDFSFSGIKTNVLYTLKGANGKKEDPILVTEKERKDIAAAFQETVLLDVVEKSFLAAKTFDCKAIYLGGGVTNNQRLRDLFSLHNHLGSPLFFPDRAFSLDNGVMIAGLGYHIYQKRGAGDPITLEPTTRMPLG